MTVRERFEKHIRSMYEDSFQELSWGKFRVLLVCDDGDGPEKIYLNGEWDAYQAAIEDAVKVCEEAKLDGDGFMAARWNGACTHIAGKLRGE